MSQPKYRSAPQATSKMPPGIPFIVGNEAAERFSFYGMKGILVVFMTKYLHLMGDSAALPMSDAEARQWFHTFSAFVYLTPILGAVIADAFWGKYRTILWLSFGYCIGHGLLALMGSDLMSAGWLLFLGLFWITIGAGGIKPCVSAHVGDQFGKTNSHLLTKVFNYFYWSINFGALLSHLLTPWLLEWYGPHWAFGVPGVLMAIATLVFWLGRWKFIHIPPKGAQGFLKETLSREGLQALGKLSIIYVFVAMFWALFDQTASAWVQQADDMDLDFLGITWLPAQVQAVNPILILAFIPLFTFVIYPQIDKFFPLTALRKMAIGFFVMTFGFGVTAVAQVLIDAGNTPSIGWQFFAWIFVTAAEIMISIVCLEFSYTQAPRAMKSFIMGAFFCSVFIGNIITAGVNQVIQIPSVLSDLEEQHAEAEDLKAPATIRDAGPDGEEGTEDDVVATFKEGTLDSLQMASQPVLDEGVTRIESAIEAGGFRAPAQEEGQQLLEGLEDPWGNPLRYTLVTSKICRVASDGPDEKRLTRWDQGYEIHIDIPQETSESVFRALEPEEPWLERRVQELKVEAGNAPASGEESGPPQPSFQSHPFVGGLTRLEGAGYYWFFTILMGITGVLFVVVMRFYTPKEYLHEEESVLEAESESEAAL